MLEREPRARCQFESNLEVPVTLRCRCQFEGRAFVAGLTRRFAIGKPLFEGGPRVGGLAEQCAQLRFATREVPRCRRRFFCTFVLGSFVSRLSVTELLFEPCTRVGTLSELSLEVRLTPGGGRQFDHRSLVGELTRGLDVSKLAFEVRLSRRSIGRVLRTFLRGALECHRAVAHLLLQRLPSGRGL